MKVTVPFPVVVASGAGFPWLVVLLGFVVGASIEILVIFTLLTLIIIGDALFLISDEGEEEDQDRPIIYLNDRGEGA